MGCDIHCYIEFKEAGSDYWRSFCGRINPGRNYCLFGMMAGVRGIGPAIVAPRGYPDDASYEANDDYWMYIVRDREPEDGETTEERASRWVACGARYKGEFSPYTRTHTENGVTSAPVLVGAQHDGKPTHVSHPDWHTHSWITTDEFAQVLSGGCPIKYSGMLGAMRALEQRGADVRLVFWFDN